ncbi:hypothetical protein EW026_g4941 [Hermanssonia centrifuga]|uniref:Uncharacterized protein n=1 Tax=Hermanssonia centrifuga TaxID=98765 RepID=A0A4S4KFQ8_9APHY|nr:hypothetical protein EW026_g4941 [Hermanssonia centrifuga]
MHMVFFITTASTTHYHLAASLALSKLYSNSVLALLNTRVRIIGGRDMSPQTEDTSLSYISSGNSAIKLPRLPILRHKNPLTVEIEITQERSYNKDGNIVLEEMSEHKFGDNALTGKNATSTGGDLNA